MFTAEAADTRAAAAAAVAAALRTDLAAAERMLTAALGNVSAATTPDAAHSAACNVASAVGALGPKSLAEHSVVDVIDKAMRSAGKGNAREAGAAAVGCLCAVLGEKFEPYALGLMARLIQVASRRNLGVSRRCSPRRTVVRPTQLRPRAAPSSSA